jgi:hypothetical protein
MPHGLEAWIVSCAVVYLLASYAIGGPVALVRALVVIATRRRARYRAIPDEVLASSRFTIPVSVILPAGDGPVLAEAVERLLAFTYPEHEVIVVASGGHGLSLELRQGFGLKAREIFFRRTLPMPTVHALYRSERDPRLLVIECGVVTRGEALNCGVNLARYRYVCCADPRARYAPGSLLAAMQPAVEDPGAVVGVTTSLSADTGQSSADGARTESLTATLQRLSGLRELLGRGGRRRMHLRAEGLPGLTLWRRDAVLDVGGFATDVVAEDADLTLRIQRLLLDTRQPCRIVHIAEPVGTTADEHSLAMLMNEERQRCDALTPAVWRSRGLLLNPSYGRTGLVDAPQLLLTTAVVPWFELVCLAALPFAPAAGVLTLPQLLAVMLAIGIGNALLIETALLKGPIDLDERRALAFVLLAPVEVFVGRPARLWARVRGLARSMTRSAPVGT